MAVRKASEITSAALRVKNQELALISSPMSRVEGHTGHSNLHALFIIHHYLFYYLFIIYLLFIIYSWFMLYS